MVYKINEIFLNLVFALYLKLKRINNYYKQIRYYTFFVFKLIYLDEWGTKPVIGELFTLGKKNLKLKKKQFFIMKISFLHQIIPYLGKHYYYAR